MKLNLPNDCDNSPKRKIIQELFFAFLQRNYDAIHAHLTDDIVWEIVGDRLMNGKEDIAIFLETHRVRQVEDIYLDYILAHGKFGAVGGKIIMTTDILHFTEFYDFASVGSKKINKIKSFVIRGPKPL